MTEMFKLVFVLVLWCAAVTVTEAAVNGRFNVSTLAFNEGFSHLFGNNHLVRSGDGRSVQLFLSRYTGSGFISSDMYHHGFFSASIKLPADYTAGVVVAFYTSNGDVFAKNHDELDFEFLGNRKGEEWRIQTNLYGNGSTSRGREERYLLPFDPTQEAHTYSILWTSENIIFYIDDTPIREVRRSMGGDYPSKPMSLYATIWDGSTWATDSGRHKINYKYAPFVAEFSNLVIDGCRSDPIQILPPAERCTDVVGELTPQRRMAMRRFREKYMTYSFCHDAPRYPSPLPDCERIPSEMLRTFKNALAANRRRRSKRQSKRSVPAKSASKNHPFV